MCADFMAVFQKIGNIGRDVVDAWVVSTREQKAHVHHNNVVIVLNGGHVFANAHFAHTTNRDYLKGGAWGAWLFRLFGQTKLPATITVIDTFIDRNVDDMLAGLRVHIVVNAALRPKHLTLAGGGGVKYGVIGFLLGLHRPFGRIVLSGVSESSLTHSFYCSFLLNKKLI